MHWKHLIMLICLCGCLVLAGKTAFAADKAAKGTDCAPDTVQLLNQSGSCVAPDTSLVVPGSVAAPAVSSAAENSRRQPEKFRKSDDSGNERKSQSAVSVRKTILYFFWGQGCPHCEEEKVFLAHLKQAYPSLEIRSYEVWHNRDNARLMAEMLQARGQQVSGVPVTLVHDRVLVGFSGQTSAVLEQILVMCRHELCLDPATLTGPVVPDSPPISQENGASDVIRDTRVIVPLFGELDMRQVSLPLLTLIIAGMDSFNPCAFFVLLTLLGLLTHVQSRRKMLLIGGIFVSFSGLIYFLFMAAWLNLFLVMGHVGAITMGAGLVSLGIALINIKDFFLFKQGVSLTIPDSAKPRLFERMRRLMRSTSLVPVIAGTSALALLANFYELLCTAGFPMVFTRILTLNNLSPSVYYLYLLLYNVIYVIPLLLIVLGFTCTLSKHQLSEWQGRVLKLVSGTMMLELGVVLLVKPELMNSLAASVALLGLALAGSLLVAVYVRRAERSG